MFTKINLNYLYLAILVIVMIVILGGYASGGSAYVEGWNSLPQQLYLILSLIAREDGF